MSYYNRDHKKIKLDDFEYLNSGGCASILYNKEVIFKKYKQSTLYRII